MIERIRWMGPEMRVLADGSEPPVISDARALAAVGNVADAREWEVKRRSAPVIKVDPTLPSAAMGSARAAPTRPHVVP